MADAPEYFSNANQVFRYLQSHYPGRKISLRSVHNHYGTHRLPEHEAGVCLRRQVDAYAKDLPLRDVVPPPSATAPLPDADGGAVAIKVAAQARLATVQAVKAELALERERGTLVPAADQAITLASFAAVVEHELKSQMRTGASRLLALVQGDSQRRAAFTRELTDMVDAALRHAAEIEEYRVQFESLGAAE